MRQRRTVALLPWGDVIEDFLEDIGVSLNAFCERMTGGWLFGYVEALQKAGLRTVVVCVSAQVHAPVRRAHLPTGASLWLLPAPHRYRLLRRRMRDPQGWTVEQMFGAAHGLRRRGHLLMRSVAPYAALPLGPLRRVLRREGCDAVLCQEYEYARFDLCVALGTLLGVPVFATFQGGNAPFSRLEELLRPWTLRACAGLIIAPQEEGQRVRADYGVPPCKTARVFNPLDLNTWFPANREAARAVLGLPRAARVAAWHGRVDMRRKGLDLLLEAWGSVCESYPEEDLRLLLIGTGQDAAELRRRLIARDPRGVRWIDEYVLERATMRTYLSAADVYVFPSRHEGFPVAPVEAMACGLPVVAAAAPGVPDIFENGPASGGLVVPRGEAAALAAVLGPLLNDSARCRTLGASARRRVEAAFSPDVVGRQLRAFLMERS